MKDYIYEWERLGYGYIVERFRKVFSLKAIHSLIKKSFLSIKRQEAIFKLISKRSRELCS